MISSCILIFWISLIAHFSPCECVVDVEYKDKIVSEHKGDMFGATLSTSENQIVIGAPSDMGKRGSVLVEDIQRTSSMIQESHRIQPPPGVGFGRAVSVNQQFIVVAGRRPWGEVYHPAVYVYEANSPYSFKATIPYHGGFINGVAISDDNMILVDCSYAMITYVYDGQYQWHLGDKLEFGETSMALALSGSRLAVGFPHVSHEQGLVHVYNYIDGRWVKQQSIQEHNVQSFGASLALYGDHMAVGLFPKEKNAAYICGVSTYEFNTDKKIWINNGRFSTPGYPRVSIHQDILVATVIDQNNPDVSGYAYKLSKMTNNNDINGSVALYKWSQMARLTTKSDPITRLDQYNRAVRVQQPFVFIGRARVGKVFMYDLSNV